MQVNKKQAELLSESITYWQTQGYINQELANKLNSSLQVQSFDWRKLTKYSFWIALICIVTAVSSVIADKMLMELIEKIFHAPYEIKCVFFVMLAGALFTFGAKRKNKFPEKFYSNEAFLFLGVLSTAASIYQLGRWLDTGTGHFSLLLLLSFIVYGVLGWVFQSNLIWLFSLVSLGGWMGTETGYMSGWGAYYLGMNYPLRFVLFGAVLTAIALITEKMPKLNLFYRTTLVMGLLYFFIALWIMSIFGNYGDISSWDNVKQYELFHWSVLFGLGAFAAILHGLKMENGISKGFGITFLFINLYTRFFEYFWEATHKAIFFAILGFSFWLLGTKAEKIWQLNLIKKDLKT